MSFKPLTIAAAASIALVLLSQGNAVAGFLVEHDDSWYAVGENVGSGPTVAEANEQQPGSSHTVAEFLAQFLTRDAAHFGRIGCSTPGGMSAPTYDGSVASGPVLMIVPAVHVSVSQCAMWLVMDGPPQMAQPLSTRIMRPPRSLAAVG